MLGARRFLESDCLTWLGMKCVVEIIFVIHTLAPVYVGCGPLVESRHQGQLVTNMDSESAIKLEKDVESPCDNWKVLTTVFVGVTTTGRYHRSRLGPVLDTWYPGLANQTWFFTDTLDPPLTAVLAGSGVGDNTAPHRLVVLPHCGSDHSRAALACKMEAQLTTFLQLTQTADGYAKLEWFCHLDDDNYVNRRALAALLAAYDGRNEDWYLGKASIPEPLELPLESVHRDSSFSAAAGQRFWFATGGAGFCLSRHLVERARPWILGGRFRQLADDIRLPDDVTVGYLVEVVLGGHLAHIATMHSHLEPLQGLTGGMLDRAVTLSYGRYEDTGAANVVGVASGQEMEDEDVTRFYAVHCILYPSECQKPGGEN